MSTTKQQRKQPQGFHVRPNKRDRTTSFNIDSAEGKALKRMKDVNDPSQWITRGEIGKEINVDAINERLRQRGYKIQVSFQESQGS